MRSNGTCGYGSDDPRSRRHLSRAVEIKRDHDAARVGSGIVTSEYPDNSSLFEMPKDMSFTAVGTLVSLPYNPREIALSSYL